MVSFAFGAGANPMIENESGHRPVSYARSKEMIELLETYESKVNFCWVPQSLVDWDQWNLMSRIFRRWEIICNFCVQFQDLQRRKELEERRRFPLEQRIREVIVGQEGAITTVASGRHRSKSFGFILRGFHGNSSWFDLSNGRWAAHHFCKNCSRRKLQWNWHNVKFKQLFIFCDSE